MISSRQILFNHNWNPTQLYDSHLRLLLMQNVMASNTCIEVNETIFNSPQANRMYINSASALELCDECVALISNQASLNLNF